MTGSILSNPNAGNDLAGQFQPGHALYFLGRSNSIAHANYPLLQDIPDQTSLLPFSLDFSFTITLEFGSDYMVSPITQDESLVPMDNLNITGTGLTRALAVTPAARSGQATLGVFISDGSIFSGTTFLLNIAQPTVNTPPTLTGAKVLADGRFEFNFGAQSGRSYRVESSTNLTSWTQAGLVNANTNSASFTDPGLRQTRLFYRVILVPLP
jgi:hypothetical protein